MIRWLEKFIEGMDACMYRDGINAKGNLVKALMERWHYPTKLLRRPSSKVMELIYFNEKIIL